MSGSGDAITVTVVTDRTLDALVQGAEFERWPGEIPPAVGQRVYVYDRTFDFTQHDVRRVEGMRVWIGPAIEWPRDEMPSQ